MVKGSKKNSRDDLDRVDEHDTDYTNSVFLSTVLAKRPSLTMSDVSRNGNARSIPGKPGPEPEPGEDSMKGFVTVLKPTVRLHESPNAVVNDTRSDQSSSEADYRTAEETVKYHDVESSVEKESTEISAARLSEVPKKAGDHVDVNDEQGNQKEVDLDESTNAVVNDAERDQTSLDVEHHTEQETMDLLDVESGADNEMLELKYAEFSAKVDLICAEISKMLQKALKMFVPIDTQSDQTALGLDHIDKGMIDHGQSDQNISSTSYSCLSNEVTDLHEIGSSRDNVKPKATLADFIKESAKRRDETLQKAIDQDKLAEVIRDDFQIMAQVLPQAVPAQQILSWLQSIQRTLDCSQERAEAYIRCRESYRDAFPMADVKAQLRNRDLSIKGHKGKLRKRLRHAYVHDEQDEWRFEGAVGWRAVLYDGLGMDPRKLQGESLVEISERQQASWPCFPGIVEQPNPDHQNIVAQPTAHIRFSTGIERPLMLLQRGLGSVGILHSPELSRKCELEGEQVMPHKILMAGAVEIKTSDSQRTYRALALLCEGMARVGFVYCMRHKFADGNPVLGGDVWIEEGIIPRRP